MMNSAQTVPARDGCFEIIDRIAELEDTSPTKLPPLYDVIDPEHLNTLLESDEVRIEFSYFGYQIALSSEGIQSITADS